MRASIHYLLVTFPAIALIGCLTVESKEYHIKLRTDHSGEATIKFINIMSEADDTTDISHDDFHQLIDLYLLGTQLEKDNPGFRNVKKRLYEQDGVLVGEVSMTFDSLAALRLFKFNAESPYMYFVGNPLSSEQFVETNGIYGRDWMPMVFWPKDTRDLYLKTKVVSEVTYHRSLLKQFKDWQAQKESDQPQKGSGTGPLGSGQGRQTRPTKQ